MSPTLRLWHAFHCNKIWNARQSSLRRLTLFSVAVYEPLERLQKKVLDEHILVHLSWVHSQAGLSGKTFKVIFLVREISISKLHGDHGQLCSEN